MGATFRDVLNVPTLRQPLYSLRSHHRQRGCGFLGSSDMGGMFVYFPTFVLKVDTSVDCHLDYQHMGRSLALSDLDYVQPRCELTDSPATASASEEDDWKTMVSFASHNPKCAASDIPLSPVPVYSGDRSPLDPSPRGNYRARPPPSDYSPGRTTV